MPLNHSGVPSMNYANMIEESNLKKTFIIATLISTMIGTFTTGINLYDRVGEKRRQKKTDNSQDHKIKELEERVANAAKWREELSRREWELQRSLAQGGPAIRQEYNQDLARLGPRFAQGDDIAQNQLQSQIITLQGTVIHLLEDALTTGRLENVNKLYNASEFARQGSIDALKSQYQRMLQSAPVNRPVGPVRRISSTPTMKQNGARSAKSQSVKAPSVRSEKQVTEIHIEEDAPPANGSVKETAALASFEFDASGPLFCHYAINLQETDDALDICFAKGGSQACPLCGTRVPVEAGRAWKIEKERVKEKVKTRDFVDEVIEQRTFLISNRFIIKSHREKAGYSCLLCYQHRDRDTICESIGGLVKHIWQKHEVAEYESDPDLKEVSLLEERISKRY